MKATLTSYLNLAIICCSLFLFSACQSQQTDKSIGLQLYSLRDDINKDVPGIIQQVGQTGYSFVEAAGYGDGKIYGMEPEAFKSLVEKNGMQFLSSHTGQALPDSAHWAETMAWWDKCIDAHARAGVTYIVQPFMDNAGYDSLQGLDNYCRYFNAIGQKCKARGILFGYHNHDKEFSKIDDQVIYDYMLQHTDSAVVFFQMDLWWTMISGADPVAYFKNYPGRFTLWHVKDKNVVGKSGRMDFKHIFENAEVSGMKHFIVEVEEYEGTPMEDVEASYEYLENTDFVK